MTIFVKIKHKTISMKKILIAAVALVIAFAPASLAQRPGGPRPGARPDTEKKDDKKDEPEKPAPELKVTAGLFGVAQHEKDWYFDIPDSSSAWPSTKRTGTSTFPTASLAAESWP